MLKKILLLVLVPFHQEAVLQQYRKNSLLRKPAPGMVLKQFRHFPIDLSRSAMIGDKESDRISLLLKGTWIVSEMPREQWPSKLLESFKGL